MEATTAADVLAMIDAELARLGKTETAGRLQFLRRRFVEGVNATRTVDAEHLAEIRAAVANLTRPQLPVFVRHVDVYGGHGFIFRAADGRVMLEHCHQGRWGCCPLPVATDDLAARPVRVAAMKHLQRKAHPGVEAQQLAGFAHAGGGAVPYVKGPAR